MRQWVAGAVLLAAGRPRLRSFTGYEWRPVLALLAATCWACYILLNRTVGQRLPGAQGSAAAALVSALVHVPIGLVVLVLHPPTAYSLGEALTAGVLSSAIPFLVDLFALRRVPPAVSSATVN